MHSKELPLKIQLFAIVVLSCFAVPVTAQQGSENAHQGGSQSASSQENVTGTHVNVQVTGLSPTGTLRIGLFDSATGFPKTENTCQSFDVPVDANTATLKLPPIAFGTYAIAVFHDINGNGKLDKSGFGIPTEPYGFSKNARGSFGPPSFQSAAFEVSDAAVDLDIRVR